MHNPQLAIASANAMAEALSALLNTGWLRIYTGEQPVNADTAITDQILLAELRFSADFAPVAANGTLIANAITADASANASGTAEWARLFKSDGTTVVLDCAVDEADADIVLSDVDIVAATVVSVTSCVITVPLAGETLAEIPP